MQDIFTILHHFSKLVRKGDVKAMFVLEIWRQKKEDLIIGSDNVVDTSGHLASLLLLLLPFPITQLQYSGVSRGGEVLRVPWNPPFSQDT